MNHKSFAVTLLVLCLLALLLPLLGQTIVGDGWTYFGNEYVNLIWDAGAAYALYQLIVRPRLPKRTYLRLVVLSAVTLAIPYIFVQLVYAPSAYILLGPAVTWVEQLLFALTYPALALAALSIYGLGRATK